MEAPATGRSLRPIVRRVLVFLVVLYALALLVLYLFQRSLIYRPELLSAVPLSALRPGQEFVTFPSKDGTRISGLLVRPRTPEALVAFVAHGNAGNALTWAGYLAPYLKAGLGAFLLDPRGYGLSHGSPDEAGWLEDGEAAVEWLDQQGIPASRLVMVGVSIGSGLAVPLAAHHPVRALILESACSSLLDAASDHFPFVPCGLLLRDHYDNVALAPEVHCPVLLLHGTADATFPIAHAERLARAFPPVPVLRRAEGCGHNDVSRWPGYRPSLTEFLDKLP